jgi:hypothetical protein
LDDEYGKEGVYIIRCTSIIGLSEEIVRLLVAFGAYIIVLPHLEDTSHSTLRKSYASKTMRTTPRKQDMIAETYALMEYTSTCLFTLSLYFMRVGRQFTLKVSFGNTPCRFEGKNPFAVVTICNIDNKSSVILKFYGKTKRDVFVLLENHKVSHGVK